MEELLPLIMELCHIATIRNEINTRRHRARFRKNYYAKAVRIVEAHNQSNKELRRLLHPLYIGRSQARINSIKSDMAWLVKKHPKPKKWQEMGLYKLRSLVLQGEAEYALAKHETMEFSIRKRFRVKDILTAINGRIIYENGSVVYIKTGNTLIAGHDIEKYADQYKLSQAIESMIEE